MTVMLQLEGVWLGKRELASKVGETGSPPLSELLAKYLAGGNRLLLGGPCVKKRGLEGQEPLDGAVLAAAPTFIRTIKEANTVVTY